MFWFNQRADLTEELADDVKLLFTVRESGMWVTWVLVALGLVFVITGGVFIYMKRKSNSVTSYGPQE